MLSTLVTLILFVQQVLVSGQTSIYTGNCKEQVLYNFSNVVML